MKSFKKDLKSSQSPAIVLNVMSTTKAIDPSDLRSRLRRLNLSPERFAVYAGVSNVTVRNYMDDDCEQAPLPSTVEKINKTLDDLEAMRREIEESRRARLIEQVKLTGVARWL